MIAAALPTHFPSLVTGVVAALALIACMALSNVALAAGASTLAVSATVLSKNKCSFNSANSALSFGTVNPSNATDVIATTTLSFRCTGSSATASFAISDDSGLYSSGPAQPRLKHGTLASEYLPYSLSYSPQSGSTPKNTDTTLTVTGTLRATDYQNSYAGAYSDSVVISINP